MPTPLRPQIPFEAVESVCTVSLMVLLPKDGGRGLGTGSQRPIFLLNLLYRLWAGVRYHDAKEWMRTNNIALAEGALEEAWTLGFEAEHAAVVGESFGALFTDLTKAYDHIALHDVFVEARRRGFPEALLHLTLQQAAAPKYIRCGDTVAAPVRPTHGLVPGCAFAVLLLHLVLRDTVTSAITAGSLTADCHIQGRQYVDDVVLYTQHFRQFL